MVTSNEWVSVCQEGGTEPQRLTTIISEYHKPSVYKGLNISQDFVTDDMLVFWQVIPTNTMGIN